MKAHSVAITCCDHFIKKRVIHLLSVKHMETEMIFFADVQLSPVNLAHLIDCVDCDIRGGVVR